MWKKALDSVSHGSQGIQLGSCSREKEPPSKPRRKINAGLVEPWETSEHLELQPYRSALSSQTHQSHTSAERMAWGLSSWAGALLGLAEPPLLAMSLAVRLKAARQLW